MSLRFWPQLLHFIPYLGGKHFLVKRLLPLIPPHRVYVEVFGGGASLLLAKEPSPIEVYNDIDGELVNLFITVRDRKEEFRQRLEGLPYSRALYQKYVRLLDEGHIEDQLERAVAFYYCMRSTFAGKWRGGWAFSPKESRTKRLKNALVGIDAISERLKQIHIDRLDFAGCIRNWDGPDTFFFLDPPYIETMRPRVDMTEQQHRQLADLLSKATFMGKWLLTYNDHPLVRDLYRGFAIEEMRCTLSSRKAGQGTRRRALANLVIRNYELKA